MTALVLDAGALIAIDRGDREMLARLRAAQHEGLDLKTHPLVVAQAWRDPAGRQARLARLLAATNVIPLEAATGRRAGELLAKARMSDAIDAALVIRLSRLVCSHSILL